jgi:hypothetical protein
VLSTLIQTDASSKTNASAVENQPIFAFREDFGFCSEYLLGAVAKEAHVNV